MKECKKCKTVMEENQFYKHPTTADRLHNNCKTCMKKYSNKKYYNNYENKEWLESERARQRQKYKSLKYKGKQKKAEVKKPWKATSEYKNLSRDLKLEPGIEAHHWSYKKEHLRDVFVLLMRQHRQAHRFLVFDEVNLCYKTKKGVLLDTREKHKEFLDELGIVEVLKNANIFV